MTTGEQIQVFYICLKRWQTDILTPCAFSYNPYIILCWSEKQDHSLHQKKKKKVFALLWVYEYMQNSLGSTS